MHAYFVFAFTQESQQFIKEFLSVHKGIAVQVVVGVYFFLQLHFFSQISVGIVEEVQELREDGYKQNYRPLHIVVNRLP